MSLSDLDYVNAAVSRSETRSGATNGVQDATPRPDGEASPPSSAAGEAPERSDGEARADGPPPPAGTSLAALLATLQTVTVDAQQLGSSLDEAAESTRQAGEVEGVEPSTAGEDEGDLDLDSLQGLLAKLDETEGVADDLEGRLDGLIGDLDRLLGVMGAGAGASADSGAATTTVAAEPKEEEPDLAGRGEA